MSAQGKKRKRTAGLFGLLGLLLLGVILIESGLFRGRFASHYPLYIEFPATAGLLKNSEVRLRGDKVGHVATIPAPAAGTVRMEMHIRNGVKIPRDSQFCVGSSQVIPPDVDTGFYYQPGDTVTGAGAEDFDTIKPGTGSLACHAPGSPGNNHR